jgi:aldehyde dehydrogenase (NAD+)
VGERIAQKANAKKNTRVQLELGGKNPAIVLDDADIDRAVAMIIRAAFGLSGQACTATSRAIVHDKVYDEFTRKLIERIRRIKVGNGLQDGVEMGPVVGENEMNKILQYVNIGISEGAKLLYGGKRLTSEDYIRGYFIEPTVFSEVTPDMRIAQEEIFGPVLALMRASSFDEAIEIANKTEYGLTASIYTSDIRKAFEFIKNVQAGVVKVNKPTTGLEIHVPFGGFKKSSNEMFKEQGEAALDFYTKIKTVYLSF